MDFATALRAHIESDPKITRRGKRLLAVLDLPESDERRGRILDRLERHTRVHLGVGEVEAINWKSIDWQKILDFIIKILPLILAMFGL